MKSLGAAIFLPGLCGCPSPRAPWDSELFSAPITQVRFLLAWDAEGVVFDGEGWSTTTDLGYQVTVTQGHVTSYALYLNPCDDSAAWTGLWWLRAAHAGHGLPEEDAAMIAPWVENIAQPASSAHDSVLFPARRFCSASYIVARADARARNLPETIDMTDLSLWVEGWYTAPGAEQETAFLWQSSLSYGQSTDVLLSAVDHPPTLLVERRLSRLFDGIDMQRETPPVIGQKIIKNMLENTMIAEP